MEAHPRWRGSAGREHGVPYRNSNPEVYDAMLGAVHSFSLDAEAFARICGTLLAGRTSIELPMGMYIILA